ncbi:MAG: 50S ribosomal protein L13 [Candidatus Nealsonbacteria bacterium]
MERKTHKIDAEGKVLGRLSTEIAVLLRGKQKIGFAPNKDIGDFVLVKNVEKIKFTGNKMENKKYYRHSGYIGSLKEVPLKKLFERDPKEVLRRAVKGMLPHNKLQSLQINRLKFE